MEQILRGIVARIAETTPEFDADASFRDVLNVDSVRTLEMVFEIERTLGIAIPESRYRELRSLNDALKLVTGLQPAAS